MDYNKLMEFRNANNPFAAYVGIRTTKIAHGYAEAVLSVKPEHLNPVGFVHGGCLFTLADVVTGAASASFGFHGVTVSGEYHYLTPAKDAEQLFAAAKCIKSGKKILVFDVTVFSANDTVVGKGTFTTFLLDKKMIEPNDE